MPRIKTLITILLLSAAAGNAGAQLRFDNLRHDFGTLLWNEPGHTTFNFRNTGTDTLRVRDIRPDCGCTAVKWTETPIAPGGEGVIDVSFDAALLGHFEKQLAVYTDHSRRPVYLTVSGDVARERVARPENFAYHVGDLFFETDNVEFDDVRRGDMPTKTLTVYNAGKQSTGVELMHLPKYLTATVEPESIRPERTGRVTLTLNSELLRGYGLTQTDIYVSRFAGDRVNRGNEIAVSATLLPELSYTDDELSKAPVAALDSTTVHLGDFGKKKRLKTELTLRNTGESALKINALQVYNPGISVSLSKQKLDPGESDRLKITVNTSTSGFKGRRSILLITNDPLHPKIVIDIIIKK